MSLATQGGSQEVVVTTYNNDAKNRNGKTAMDIHTKAIADSTCPPPHSSESQKYV